MFNALGSCPNVQTFWTGVHEFITEIIETNYQFSPSLYKLESPRPLKEFAKPLAHWIQISIMISKQMIMRKWKAVEDPMFQD